jgi:hypothetical protein
MDVPDDPNDDNGDGGDRRRHSFSLILALTPSFFHLLSPPLPDPSNTIVASNEYASDMFDEARSSFYVEDVTWIAGSPPLRLTADDGKWIDGQFIIRIRHGPTMVNGTLTLDADDHTGASGKVNLDTKDKGLAPGQYCVFYALEDEECLGAGVISERHWAKFLVGVQ